MSVYFRSRRRTRFHVVNQRCFISVLCSTLHSASRLQPLMTCVRSMLSTVDCFLPSKSYNHCNVVGSCSLAVKLLVESTLHVVNDDLVFSVQSAATAHCKLFQLPCSAYFLTYFQHFVFNFTSVVCVNLYLF